MKTAGEKYSNCVRSCKCEQNELRTLFLVHIKICGSYGVERFKAVFDQGYQALSSDFRTKESRNHKKDEH